MTKPAGAAPSRRKGQLRRAFDAAAGSYEANAPVQRAAAARLAQRIAVLPLPANPRILEIGCGAGFLSAALRPHLGPADWTFTDLSPAMLEVCRERLGHPADAAFHAMDGEHPDLEPGFDLICSSLTFQWFEDLPAAVGRLTGLLAPGGWLAFATLAEESLVEWRSAHAALGLKAGTPAFPPVAALSDMGGEGGRVEDERLVHVHADARAFLTSLKAIGARSPTPRHAPLAAAALGRVMRRFEAAGAAVTYHVAYGLFRRQDAPPRGVFVTGTDTGAGKTVVSACLAAAWGADYWKPVQTGVAEEPGDTATVAALARLPAPRLHAPAYAFAAPLSPDAAARGEGAAIALETLNLPASHRPVVVEGAGGALVPLGDGVLMIDLMARLGLPVVVVAPNRLGAINQTLLTLKALRGRGLEVLGVVLVGPPFADNRAAIAAHGRVRIIAELPWSDPVGPEMIAEWAGLIPPLADLRA